MAFPRIKIGKTKKQFLAVLLLYTFSFSLGWAYWTGTWEGSMGSGSNRFRVAFVLGQSSGEYHNIDDGIHAEPLTIISRGGNRLKARTEEGGVLELSPDESDRFLTGSFYQGTGKDSQLSLVGEGKTYPVTLHRGEDFLHPRLMPSGAEESQYSYEPPKDLADGWEPADLRQAKADVPQIEGVVRKILGREYPYIHSLVLVKNGKLALEEYFYGYGPTDTHPVQSITKPVFSLLFGIAEAQGLCQVSQKVYDFFPSYRQSLDWDARKNKITLGDLLTMTSGLGCDDSKDSKDCSWPMFASHDWLDFSLNLPLNEEPGSHFAYCGSCLTPLGAILEKKSGLKLPDYAQKFLFDPLGIPVPSWWEGSQGIHSPAFGLALTPRDMAKIGYLVLKRGNWKGRQVVTEKWIRESTASHVPSPKTDKKSDYGYLWWERDVDWHGKKLRVLDAWGVGGQHIFIVPGLDLVCVLTGGNYKDGGLANHSFEIFKKVMEAFKPLVQK
jgi:CubicO group peptidase (beta-lactamase class C family)